MYLITLSDIALNFCLNSTVTYNCRHAIVVQGRQNFRTWCISSTLIVQTNTEMVFPVGCEPRLGGTQKRSHYYNFSLQKPQAVTENDTRTFFQRLRKQNKGEEKHGFIWLIFLKFLLWAGHDLNPQNNQIQFSLTMRREA